MELPQPSLPFAVEGTKAMHDFLSLRGHSPLQQDRGPSSSGEYLKTHNFLHPLEEEEKINLKEDNAREINNEKHSPSVPPSIEKALRGGTTYSFSHVSYFNPRIPQSGGAAFHMAPAVSSHDRNEENFNCSTYTAGSSFTLWDESSARKEKTGKQDLNNLNVAKEPMLRTGQWPIEWPSESSSNHPNSFSCRLSSQPPAQINQSFVQMLKSAKITYAKGEHEDEVHTQRTEGISQRGEIRMRVDGRASNDQKPNTPRSKHSATEQRRRCKINDRFQMLREVIPRTDEKRDKASFLLEVIEYIQFLQEKVSKYEGYPGWSSEPRLAPWGSSPKLAESFADQARAVNGPVLLFKPADKNNVITTNIQGKQQNSARPHINNPNAMDQQTGLTNKATSIPIPQLKADSFTSLTNKNAVTQPACKPAASDADDVSLQQLQLWQSRAGSSEFNSTMSKQELTVEGSTISISRIYSRGLLNTLTQALKSSGVDVSQTSISVQVDIGKQTNPVQSAPKNCEDFDINCDSRNLVHERVESSCLELEESNHTTKKLKTLNS